MMNQKIVNALSAMAILAAPPVFAAAFSRMDAGNDFGRAASVAKETFSLAGSRVPHLTQRTYN